MPDDASAAAVYGTPTSAAAACLGSSRGCNRVQGFASPQWPNRTMDQTVGLRAGEHARALGDLIAFVSDSIDRARASDTPFYHLEFDRVFPEDIYAAMLAGMPVTSDYRRMSGRRKEDQRADGTPTRVKIDLFPEYIRSLPAE